MGSGSCFSYRAIQTPCKYQINIINHKHIEQVCRRIPTYSLLERVRDIEYNVKLIVLDNNRGTTGLQASRWILG